MSDTDIQTKKFLTPKETALYLGVSRGTVDKLVQDGVLPAPTVLSPRVRRFKREDIDELHNTGSPMPIGLTSVLSRPQLLDLIQYLSELGKIK